MTEIVVTLRTPVPSERAPEIAQRIFFVSSAITGFELVERDAAVCAVVLHGDEELDGESLSERVNLVVENDVGKQQFVPPRTIWRSSHSRAADDRVFAELAAAGTVAELGEGQVAMGEPLIGLTEYFDLRIRDLVNTLFDAVEFRYPTLVPRQVLQESGYFHSFPQHLMFVTRLHSDIDTYRDFRTRQLDSGGLDGSLLGLCDDVDYCLPPTMCYHTFGQYRGRAIGPALLHTVTSRGKSFRYESRYATTLERLWDFTIRETVFMGERIAVLRARERLMKAAFGLVEELGLTGSCEVANDPFFGEADTPLRIWSQRLLELKYELRLDVAPGRSVAVGSFNFHDEFFGKGFGITRTWDTPGPVSSGCVGFGLERLVYAFLCQYGTDPSDWPTTVAEGCRTKGERSARTPSGS
ncbi:hypothetical protein ACFYMW_30095 [Streptomyces sp. NPDC006692]|uniref:hypothetical protein n=1 Tax=unclassified Streptomyces TaxID=2593676 RepID=UPI00368A7780